MDSKVLFDIGANFGDDSLNKTRNNPNYVTYAFEPTPELAAHLRAASFDFTLRYFVIEKAVSDFDGRAVFNIADHEGSNWGCSSLNDFNDNLEAAWPGRYDLKFNRSISVDVVRLDTWINQNAPFLKKIDHFHCDVQGSDLKVLQGMGDYIHLIKEGVVECAYSEKGKLYKTNHLMSETIDYLISKDFHITQVLSNDYAGEPNEVNVYFKNNRT